MNILRSILFSVVNLLISIGDFVLAGLFFPSRLIGNGGSSLKNIKPHKKLKGGTFQLSKPKRKTIFRINIKPVVYGMRRVFIPFAITYRLILRLFIFVVTFPLGILGMLNARKERAARLKDSRRKRETKTKNGYHKPSILYKLKYVLIGFVFSFVFLFLPLVSLLFVSDLPNPSNLSVTYIPKTTKILDRNGTLLYEIYAAQNRTVVGLSDVPKNLRNATIAIEDKDFYSHPGFDLRGIARAFITNVQNRGFQGGSTITQQLIKSAFLSPDPTVFRKIKEIALAFWTERVYSKDQILELYLNYVPYGGTAWGAQSASEIYFGKRVQDLSLAESAFLAGLPQSPSIYSPFFGDGNRWKGRQKEVLDAMVKQRYISKSEANTAYKEELKFISPDVPIKAPHFVMYVRRVLENRYGLSEVERGGLTVKTTLDLNTQDQAQTIVSDQVDEDAYLNITNGASLITNPQNGDILAMVGSRNYFDQERDGNVNLTTSLRQPGSSIKLITYTLALTQGYTEASILDDTPLTITSSDGGPSYTPVNYDGNFHGRVTLRSAFANSFNIPPVRLTQKFGADAVKNFGEKMGISSWRGIRDYGVSITLGSSEVKMTDLATAYGVIANSGEKINLDPILEIKSSNGATIYKKEPVGTTVVDAGTAFVLSDILADNNARSIAFGPNSTLSIPGARVSVKTGTTDSKRDNWTVGFTPDVLVATWVGNNDNTPMDPALASGVTGAAPMWNKIMTMMLEKTGTPSGAIIPENVVKKYCGGQDRYFIQGTENSVNCRVLPSVTPTPLPQQ